MKEHEAIEYLESLEKGQYMTVNIPLMGDDVIPVTVMYMGKDSNTFEDVIAGFDDDWKIRRYRHWQDFLRNLFAILEKFESSKYFVFLQLKYLTKKVKLLMNGHLVKKNTRLMG